jgi:two-component system response regulator PilR (NtrC family)
MAEAATTSRPLLLLIEDEVTLASALTANLESDFEIDVAGTVDEARLLLGSRNYAVILSDHLLPGEKQGLDFLMEAMERQPGAKRILMTGYLNPDLLGRCVGLAGLSACLLKPVDIPSLRQELKRALTR